MEHTIEAVVLAATNMEQMVEFYSNIFDIRFEELEIEDAKLYEGKWGSLDFTLVPAELSQVTTGQNPIHYDVFVSDVHQAIDLVTKHGGRTNGRLAEDDTIRAIGVFDPDENFMVFKQRIG